MQHDGRSVSAKRRGPRSLFLRRNSQGTLCARDKAAYDVANEPRIIRPPFVSVSAEGGGTRPLHPSFETHRVLCLTELVRELASSFDFFLAASRRASLSPRYLRVIHTLHAVCRFFLLLSAFVSHLLEFFASSNFAKARRKFNKFFIR